MIMISCRAESAQDSMREVLSFLKSMEGDGPGKAETTAQFEAVFEKFKREFRDYL